MTNPPAAVKLALESICLMLGEETGDWKKIRQVIIRDNFISSIVNFSSEEMRSGRRFCLNQTMRTNHCHQKTSRVPTHFFNTFHSFPAMKKMMGV